MIIIKLRELLKRLTNLLIFRKFEKKMSDPKTSQVPWVEKYRPRLVTEICGNQPIIERLDYFSQAGNCPNILLSGPPGCGKTTSILCMARSLLKESFKDAILELNASNERGIDVIRNKIKEFAQRQVRLNKDSSLGPIQHKIIILDEADSMTDAAQQALRRIMEIYSDTTRFALACNDSSKIIEPIQSRCATMRYKRCSDEDILSRMYEILAAQKITQFDDSGMKAILFTCGGDMRQAINTLESCYHGFQNITEENVMKIVDEPHPMIIKKMIDYCYYGQLNMAIKVLQSLYVKGYSVEDIISQVTRLLRISEEMDEDVQLGCLNACALTHYRIVSGCNSSILQLTGLLSTFYEIKRYHLGDGQVA